jgi:DNA-binding protein
MSESNIVYIGRKPVMTYVLVLIERLNRVKSGNIIIKARGRAISTAVDTVEVAKRFLGKDLEISVDIGTEKLNQLEGGVRNVSAMEITLTNSPTGEVEKEESKVLEETPEPPDTTGKPDESATVDEPALGEAPAPFLKEEKPSESKSEDEAPEEEKR